MVELVKPDLASADENELAAMVLRGNLQLDEIPLRNRRNVERKVSDLKREAEEKAAAEKEAAEKADVSKLTVKELRAYAKANDIDLADAKKKADILAVVQTAESKNS